MIGVDFTDLEVTQKVLNPASTSKYHVPVNQLEDEIRRLKMDDFKPVFDLRESIPKTILQSKYAKLFPTPDGHPLDARIIKKESRNVDRLQTEHPTTIDGGIPRSDLFSKHDPRQVAASWYSFYYRRPDSPTQWDQGPQESVPSAQESDTSRLLSRNSKLSDVSSLHQSLVDLEDLEVEDIFRRDRDLVSTYRPDSREDAITDETRQLLMEMRKMSVSV